MTQSVVKPLSSDWTGLNRNLIATFRAYRREKVGDKYTWLPVPDGPIVEAPITDATIEHSINWQSPFENMGADQRFSTFSALLQTGALAPLGALFDQLLKSEAAQAFLRTAGISGNSAEAAARGLEGRSSVTKLNSTQVFNGLPPMKITLTAQFRAETDPLTEVERPLNQLIEWALPRRLHDDGVLAQIAKGEGANPWPSETPTIIGMTYAGSSYTPLVIESVPYPLSAPRDSNGRLIGAQVQMSIASLSAWDAGDWANSSKT